MAYQNIADLVAGISKVKKVRTVAVAVAQDAHTLEAVTSARNDGFVDPILVGDKKKIQEILEQIGEHVDEKKIIDASSIAESADMAVQLVREGKANFLMKGKLNTAEILKAILNKTTGLPHGKVVTNMALTQLPGYHKIVTLNDCAIIPYPTLEQKAAQIRAVTSALHSLGYGDDIKVSALCANENVSPKIIETVEAAELKRMNQAGEITGCIVEGPISLDIALVKSIAEDKGFDSPVAGDSDVLLFPNLVSGNLYAKAVEMAGAMPLGILLGACCPVAVTSRVTSKEIKYSTVVVASAMCKDA